jgi:hypothetical protein
LAFARLFPLIGFQIITEVTSLEDLPCLERNKLSNRHRNMPHAAGKARIIGNYLLDLAAAFGGGVIAVRRKLEDVFRLATMSARPTPPKITGD